MHVEQPHHAPSGIRDFLRQYAMIVLSILTALGLEHVAVSLQNRSAATVSRDRIEAELASNMKDLKEAVLADQRTNKRAGALLHALTDHLKQGKAIDAEIETLMNPLFGNFQISVPTFQRSAWESAIADQSAGHLPAADLRRYSEIYANAADAQTTWQLLLGGEWLTRAAEVSLDYRLGKVDERTLANVVVRFLLAAQQIEATEASLVDLISGAQKQPKIPEPKP
jgi:hypothetical protein